MLPEPYIPGATPLPVDGRPTEKAEMAIMSWYVKWIT
jgi:hypothetical protein